jgi:hypothetical protein
LPDEIYAGFHFDAVVSLSPREVRMPRQQ